MVKKFILTVILLSGFSYLFTMEKEEQRETIKEEAKEKKTQELLVDRCLSKIIEFILNPRDADKFDFEKHKLPADFEGIIEQRLYHEPKIWEILKSKLVSTFEHLPAVWDPLIERLKNMQISRDSNFIIINSEVKNKLNSFNDVTAIARLENQKILFTFKQYNPHQLLCEESNAYEFYVVSGLGNAKASIFDYDSTNCLGSLEGHSGPINSIAISKKGWLFSKPFIVTGSEDNTAKIWDKTGKCIYTLKGHNDAVTSLAISRNNQLVVTGSKDKTAKVWDKTGKCLFTLEGHESPICAVAISDNFEILTCTTDKIVKLWKQTNKKGKFECLYTFPILISENEKNIAAKIAESDDYKVQYSSEKIALFSKRNQKNLLRLEDINCDIMALCFNKDVIFCIGSTLVADLGADYADWHYALTYKINRPGLHELVKELKSKKIEAKKK